MRTNRERKGRGCQPADDHVSRHPAYDFLFTYHFAILAFNFYHLMAFAHQGPCVGKSGVFGWLARTLPIAGSASDTPIDHYPVRQLKTSPMHAAPASFAANRVVEGFPNVRALIVELVWPADGETDKVVCFVAPPP